jgi:hypothetical protein
MDLFNHLGQIRSRMRRSRMTLGKKADRSTAALGTKGPRITTMQVGTRRTAGRSQTLGVIKITETMGGTGID